MTLIRRNQTAIAAKAAEQAEFEQRLIRDRINAERDRRIRDTFVFRGVRYDFDEVSKARITGAATLAAFAMSDPQASQGDLMWHGGPEPFAWIAADNSHHQMDAATVFAFGQAAARHEAAHVFAAARLKDQSPLPADWRDPVWWP